MWFTQVSLKNPVFATMVMLALVVLGAFGFNRLQVDQFPNVDFPVVVVTTDYPGAAPEIVESEVSKKIEEAVNSIAGINSLSSRSYQGTSVVIVEFELYVDSRRAADDVREKVAMVKPFLRDEVDEPRVMRFDPASRPVWTVALVPDASLGKVPTAAEMTSWADQVLRKRLENVRGVGSVTLVGGTERAVQVELQPEAMQARGITVDQVVEAIRSENQDLPVGAITSTDQERVVKIAGRMQHPESFANIIVAKRGGSAVRLRDVAVVRDSVKENENLSLYNGERTLVLQVQKAQDENTIEVVQALNETLAESKATALAGIRMEPIGDASRPIRLAVKNVQQTLLEGALLTIGIVFLFLNSWRSTVITGLTLPIAVIGTYFAMYLFGFTINMITLMALSLCIGLLIDDAIVVRENIVRHVQMGKSSYQAALDGTKEIGLAVFATTMSIVAVFFPIGFMDGIVGKFFHQFGITIVVAVLISMFVSFTLDPMLSSVWHDPDVEKHGKPFRPDSLYNKTIGRVTHAFERFQDHITDIYQDILRWSLGHRKLTMGIAGLSFAGAIAMFPLLGTEFVPKADFSETSVTFSTPMGSSLKATEAKAREVEKIIREFPEVAYTHTTINAANAQGKQNASVYIRLIDRKERSRSVEQMSAVLRERLRTIAGITVTHVGLIDPMSGQKQLEFYVKGSDLATLDRINLQVMTELGKIPGLVDLDSTIKEPKPTVEVRPKGDASNDAGLSLNAVSNSLRTWIAGTTVGDWQAQDDQTYDVIVRLPETARTKPQDLESLPIVSGALPDGSPKVVRLSEVANVVPTTGPNQVYRRSMMRQITFSANSFGRSGGEVSADVTRVMTGIALPPGYEFEMGGSTKNMKESFSYAIQALMLAIAFIYMILASQFKSYLQPVALMTSLPLTLIGVVLALLIFQSTMSMFSVIGVVMLMGLVTKNAILLVDFANRARAGEITGQILSRHDALMLAAKVRLRPIFMTTLAMIFGMLPLALSLSEGAEQRAPMGQAVIGGVITSSILTLVVVPVVYGYMDDLANWLKRTFVKSAKPLQS